MRLLPAAAALGLAAGATRPAEASEDESIPLLVAILPVVDLGFFAFDLWAAVNDRPLPVGVAVAEIIVGAPQYMIGNIAYAQTATGASPLWEGSYPEWAPLVLLPVAAMGTALVSHGAFGVADELSIETDIDATARFGASALLGLNLPFMAAGIIAGGEGTWPSPWIAGPQVAIGAGTAAISAYAATQGDDAFWAGTGWGAATALHGIVSLTQEESATEDLPYNAVVPTMLGEGAPGMMVAGTW